MTSTPVTLTAIEIRLAALVGTERRITRLLEGGKDRPGIKPESVWTIDIEGAGAELALAKAMGWYWDGLVDVFHDQADVRHVHVRRQREHDWDMCIRPADRPGVYALVTGILPHYRIHGWAEWPHVESYEKSYDPTRESARYVPQKALRPWSDLVMDNAL